MGNEPKDPQEPQEPTEPTEPTEPKDPQEPQEPTEPKDGDGVKDKHGQPGINAEKYARDMEAKDAEIAKLQEQLAEAAKTEEGRKELQKQIDEMKASQADERVNHKLELAGCKNTKAAKALLDDYDGDVSKLKEDCPYLFEGKKESGSTGGKPAGAASDSAKRLEEARKAAGIRTKE